MKLTSNEIEAGNRGEATSLLIRSGYRVYRAEADVSGEDLVLKDHTGHLLPLQLKGRPVVEAARYGARGLWMLFPDPFGAIPGRPWFLIEHDVLFDWMKEHHGKVQNGPSTGPTRASRRRSASSWNHIG